MKTETDSTDAALLKELDAMCDVVTISKKARYLRWTQQLLSSGTGLLSRFHSRRSSNQSIAQERHTVTSGYEHLKSQSRLINSNTPVTPFG